MLTWECAWIFLPLYFLFQFMSIYHENLSDPWTGKLLINPIACIGKKDI